MRTTVATSLIVGLLAGLLAACSSTSSGLPYKPAVQPPGATVSAAYTIVSDRLRVEIDGRGRRVERAQVVKPDGSVLEAQTIEYTPAASAGGSPVSIGLGIGSFGGGGGVGIGTGVGVSTGGVVGGGGGSEVGSSIASFPLAQAGPSPWLIRVKLQGTDPADILVGGPAPR
ncbi:MAG TPA: hypothetical protein VK746_11175 [Candidatus Eisenbacteria bacterium]|jgi:hypothetical protein|nr:hypothetical protein [Candidatus Eisenbacteria bacterium]